jgi:endonuclease YncB( thermonuclease family)
MSACASKLGFVVFVLALMSGPAWAMTYTGKVTSVRDGDTVQVTTDQGEKLEVRLQAIDAPEKGRSGRAGQPYADRARDALARITSNKRVSVETTSLDSYGRHVGLLSIDTGQGEIDAGLVQVQLGLAWALPKYLPELPQLLQDSYRYAEAIAKARNRGLWSAASPQAPWLWRESAKPQNPTVAKTRSKPKAQKTHKARASSPSRQPR